MINDKIFEKIAYLCSQSDEEREQWCVKENKPKRKPERPAIAGGMYLAMLFEMEKVPIQSVDSNADGHIVFEWITDRAHIVIEVIKIRDYLVDYNNDYLQDVLEQKAFGDDVVSEIGGEVLEWFSEV